MYIKQEEEKELDSDKQKIRKDKRNYKFIKKLQNKTNKKYKKICLSSDILMLSKYFIASFKKLDIFGSEISLNYNQDNSYKTAFGGFVALGCILTLALLFFNNVMTLLEKSEVKYVTSLSYDPDPDIIEIGTDSFMIAVKYDQQNFINRPMVNITFEKRHYHRNEDGSLTQQKSFATDAIKKNYFQIFIILLIWLSDHNFIDIFRFMIRFPTRYTLNIPVPMEPCTIEHFLDLPNYSLNWTETFSAQDLNNYLCLRKGEQFKVGGSFNSKDFYHVKFVMKQCVNQTNPVESWKPVCDTPENIDKADEDARITFLLTNTLINPENYTTPVTSFVDTLIFNVQPQKMYTTANIMLNQQTMITDESLTPLKDLKESQFISYKAGDFSQQYSVGNYTNYSEIFFIRSSFYTILNRSYLKIDQVISYMGGFCQVFLLISAIIVNLFNEHMFTMELANKLYEFDIQKKNSQNKNNKINTFKKSLPSVQVIKNYESIEKQLSKQKLQDQREAHKFQLNGDSPQSNNKINAFKEKCSVDHRIQNNTVNLLIKTNNDNQNHIIQNTVYQIPLSDNQNDMNIINIQAVQESKRKQEKYNYNNDNKKKLHYDNSKNEQNNSSSNNSSNNESQEKQSHQINKIRPETPFDNQSKYIILQKNVEQTNQDDQQELQTHKTNSIDKNIYKINLKQQDKPDNIIVIEKDKQQPVSLAKIPGNKSSLQHLDKIWTNIISGQTMNQANTNADFQSEGDINSQRYDKLENDLFLNNPQRIVQTEKKPSLILQNIQNRKNDFKVQLDSKNYLEEELKTIIQRDRSVWLNMKYFVNKISCGKLYNTQEIQLINQAIERVKQDLDIFMILDRQKEIEKLKKLFLSQDQQVLFNFFPKPVISIQKEAPILTRESLKIDDHHTSTNKMKKQTTRKLNLGFKNLGVFSKAIMKFKQNYQTNKISDYQQLFFCYERLRLSKDIDEDSLMNKKLIDQLGEEMKNIFEIAFMIKHKEQNKMNNSQNEIKISSQNFIKEQKTLKSDGNGYVNPSLFKFQNEQKLRKQLSEINKEDNLSHQTQPETTDVIKKQEILSLTFNQEKQIAQQPIQIILEEHDCGTGGSVGIGDINIIKFEDQNDSSLYEQTD